MSLICHLDARGKDLSRYKHPFTKAGDTIIGGRKLILDGNGDYLENTTSIGDALGDGVTALTVAMTFKADVASGNDGLFNIGSFASTAGNVQISLISNVLYFRLNGSGFDQNVAFTDTWWKSFVVTYNGSYGKGYLNGVEVISAEYSTVVDLAGLKTIIGAYYSSTYPFDGKIGECRIYDDAKSLGWSKDFHEQTRLLGH